MWRERPLKFEISVSGAYYFGVPLAGGTLEYSFTAQDYYFDRYTDEYFSFGNDWYYCSDCGYGDSFIGNGQTTLEHGQKPLPNPQITGTA